MCHIHRERAAKVVARRGIGKKSSGFDAGAGGV